MSRRSLRASPDGVAKAQFTAQLYVIEIAVQVLPRDGAVFVVQADDVQEGDDVEMKLLDGTRIAYAIETATPNQDGTVAVTVRRARPGR